MEHVHGNYLYPRTNLHVALPGEGGGSLPEPGLKPGRVTGAFLLMASVWHVAVFYSPPFSLGLLNFNAKPDVLLLLPPPVLFPVKKDTQKEQTNKSDNTRQLEPECLLRPEIDRQKE